MGKRSGSAAYALQRVSGIAINSNILGSEGISCFVDKNKPELCAQLNEFCKNFKNTKEYEEINEMLHHMDRYEHIIKPEETGTGPELTVRMDEEYFPLTYYDTKYKTYAGIEVNFLIYFANAYNYRLKIEGGTWENMELSVMYHRTDIGIGGISEIYREDVENNGNLYMTECYADLDMVLIEVVDPDNVKIKSPLD